MKVFQVNLPSALRNHLDKEAEKQFYTSAAAYMRSLIIKDMERKAGGKNASNT